VARQGKVLDEFGITHVISIQAKPINPFKVNQNKSSGNTTFNFEYFVFQAS
jgi:hypothetical protein